jgi:hypothetical protein
VGDGASGVRAVVERAIYQGGHFRLDAHVAQARDVRLHLAAPEPFEVPADGALNLDVTEGWVIPAAA